MRDAVHRDDLGWIDAPEGVDARLLEGVTVLDLTAMGPGPRCARTLADHGARIIQLAPSRSVPQVELADWLYSWGRETERIAVDLKTPQGVAVVVALAGQVDVVLESFRPGVAERLGVGPRALRAAHPGLVYASLSGYGQQGPYASWAAHDLNWLGVCGYLAQSGRDADGLPAIPGSAIADGAGGWAATTAILAALVRRARTGEGAHLDVSVAGAVLRQTYVHIDQLLATGAGPRLGDDLLLGGRACYGVYRCGDDRLLTVAAIEPKFFGNLCRLLGLEHLTPVQHHVDRQGEVRAAFAERFATRSRDEWVSLLAPADTCVAPVNSLEEAVADPHLRAMGAVWTVTRPDGTDVSQVAPILVGGRRPSAEEVALNDRHSTDTRAIVAEFGLTEHVDELIEQGILR